MHPPDCYEYQRNGNKRPRLNKDYLNYSDDIAPLAHFAPRGFAFHKPPCLLQTTLTSASQYLFSALDSRAYLRSATVILPASWPDSCASTPVVSASGDTSDITVLPQGPARGQVWTQQSLGCGQSGDQIYLAYEKLRTRDDTLGKLFVCGLAGGN